MGIMSHNNDEYFNLISFRRLISFYLQVEVLQARHLVEAVQGDVPDVVVAQVQGLDPAQAPEGLVRKSPEVEGVGELEVADGIADLPEGVVRDVLDSVVGL